MKKKIALVLTSLLMLSLPLTALFYVQQPSAQELAQTTSAQAPAQAQTQNPSGERIHLHADPPELIDLYNPKSTDWHELYPNFSNTYHLKSWDDDWKNPDDKLSPSDQVDLEPIDPLGPCRDYHVENVTVTLKVNATESMWLYNITAIDISNPVCSEWIDGVVYHLSSWEDNGDGVLSSCDQIDLTIQPYGIKEWYHVDGVVIGPGIIDMLVTKKPMYIEYEGDIQDFPFDYPLDTQWHEVYPEFCNRYLLVEHFDSDVSGNLTVCDFLILVLKDEFGNPIPGTYAEYHVEEMTTDIIICAKYHWKIMLAQKDCNAKMEGSLTNYCRPIPCTNFTLVCDQSQPPQSQFVFAKVKTVCVVPNDIEFTLWVDWDKDGIYEDIQYHKFDEMSDPPFTIPFQWVKTGPGAEQMVVVEVHEQKYDQDRPFFEWQLTLTQKQNVTAWWIGYLTDKDGDYIPGTDFDILCNGTQQQCVVVKTPWCTVPHDVHYYLFVDLDKDGVWDEKEYVEADITQFPWIKKKYLDKMDLEFWPQEVVNIGNPICTIWHELHPVKSNYYHVGSWEPGMVLSPCDQIDMEQVEPPGPVEWFHVDDVTVDLVVFDLDTGTEHYLDYKCGYWVFKDEVEENPICSKWNEIWPDHGRCWHLTSWIDDNGDGKLSPCDTIDMTPMFPDPGPVSYFHVEQVTVTLKLTKKPLVPPLQQYYLEFMGTLDEFQAMDYIHYPICTMWHEIWPVFSQIWHLSSWEDTLALSPSDQIDIEPIEPEGPIEWYHVDKLTVAMNMTSIDFPGQWRIVKFEGSLEQFKLYHWGDPVCTQWHEVNPNYSRQWHLWEWIDDGDGILGYCDLITMVDKETGEPQWFHVETLSTDMWVTKKKPTVELEINEVQMHRYWVMGGKMDTAGQVGAFPPWPLDGWETNQGVPFATRKPYLTPLLMGQNITFTQKDPITGIVKLSVPPESYVGLNHTYFSPRVGTYFRVQIYLEEQGCGWLFTREGKNPINGSVDLITYNNRTGVYTFGPDQTPKTADDELLAGVDPATGVAGCGPPLGPCLQELRGVDGIPGTGDDPIGRGDPDGPDPPGSSLLYLPCTIQVDWWSMGPGGPVQLCYVGSLPMLMTTGVAFDIVIEPGSLIDGANSTEQGQPWEFFAGIDHEAEGYNVTWKHPKCNAYVTYVCAWSMLNVPTCLGNLDIMYEIEEKKVREDCVIADINCDEEVDIYDIVLIGLAYGSKDEGFNNPVANATYDARADLKEPRGEIDIFDLVRCAIDYGSKLTPQCIIRPW